MLITTDRMQLMTRLADVAALRQDVIAQNVANVNTPGYRTLGVSFDEALHAALQRDGTFSPPDAIDAEVVEGAGGIERDNGNNVDIDLEIARLQKNALFFKAYVQILAVDLAQFRSAIAGR